MEVQTVYLLTEEQEEAAQMLAEVLFCLPPEDRRAAVEAVLDVIGES